MKIIEMWNEKYRCGMKSIEICGMKSIDMWNEKYRDVE